MIMTNCNFPTTMTFHAGSVQRGNAMIASAGYANALRVFRDSA